MKNRSQHSFNASERYLIINADDFGLSRGVNRGIIRSYREGILTSASLMVYGKAVREAANFARRNSQFSLGLHVDLAEWIFSDGEWIPRYQIVHTEDEAEVTREVATQLKLFHELVGKEPTHLDSHQHVHRHEPARSVLIKTARALSVPLRSYSPHVAYCGDFYGQTGEGIPFPSGITIKNLLNILSQLPSGWTELGCHPGEDERLESVYRKERRKETEVLCHSRVRGAVESFGIQLSSFIKVPKTTTPP